jgi:hypothetical protein
MTITAMAQLFDLLQDKYGSPYYTNSEKSLFLNRAMVEYVGSMLPGDSENKNVEFDEDTTSKIAPLISFVNTLKMGSSGVITKAAIAAVTSPAIPWRLLNLGMVLGNVTKPIKFVRHNDWYQFQDNYFKTPSATNPKYVESGLNYNFLPINVNATIKLTVLSYPTVVDIDTAVSSNLPDFTHNEIVALALEFAGIGSRDQNLAQLLQLKSK